MSCSRQIRAAAAIGGIQIDVPELKKGGPTPEYFAKFPHGKIPAWEGKDGFLLTESHAIGRYSKNPSILFALYPIIVDCYHRDEKLYLSVIPVLIIMSRLEVLIFLYYIISYFFLLGLLTSDHTLSTVASLAPNSGLLGTLPQEAALVDQWSYFAATELVPFTGTIRGLVMGFITPYNKPVRLPFVVSCLSIYL